MREQRAAARYFPTQRRAERIGVDSNEKQIRLPREMLGRRFPHLIPIGKVDEAVREVDGRSMKQPARRRGLPQGCRHDLVDARHAQAPDARSARKVA